MEVLPEGKNFRLLTESELPDVIHILEKYLPKSIKVNILFYSQSNFRKVAFLGKLRNVIKECL